MSDKKVLSFTDYLAEPDVRFDNVETSRGEITLGSVSSADIIEWFEENDDTARQRFAGLRLLVKSFVNPDGTRIGDGLDEAGLRAAREAAVQRFAQHDALENGKLVSRCMVLNGLKPKLKEDPASKNGSSEVPSGASPTDSPSN